MNQSITQTPNNRSYHRLHSALFVLALIAVAAVFNACEEEAGPPGGPAPAISSFSPESGLAGSEVTINGANLDQVISVYFNGVKATPKSKTSSKIVVDVPSGATSGKIKMTYGAGNVQSSVDFTVTFKQVLVSDFEEEDVATVWGLSEDAGDISKSEFLTEGDNQYFHLKGADNNHNYWVGGRYTGTGDPAVYLGVAENDPSKVFFNVDVKNNEVGGGKVAQAKLVFYVHDPAQDSKKMNWEIDFTVNWGNWKTISIAADDFHRWNGSGFSPFSGNINSVSEVALYITGYDVAGTPGGGPDFSFDNVIFSEGAALGTIIQP